MQEKSAAVDANDTMIKTRMGVRIELSEKDIGTRFDRAHLIFSRKHSLITGNFFFDHDRR